MSKSRKRYLIYAGIIIFVVLACINWGIALGAVGFVFVVWLISSATYQEEVPYESPYSKQKEKEPKTPFEFASCSYRMRAKAKVGEAIKAFAEDVIINKQGRINAGELLNFWGMGIAPYQTIYASQINNVIQGLRYVGYGIVPNYQQGHKRFDYNESCILYRFSKDGKLPDTNEVRLAELFLKLMAIVIGGQPISADAEHVNKCIKLLNAPVEAHDYLNAYFRWMTQKKQTYDKRTKDAVALLPKEAKRIFVKLLTEAVCIDSNIDSSRIGYLKKILPTLDHEASSVHSLVHQSLTDEGFATVEKQSGATEYRIRPPKDEGAEESNDEEATTTSTIALNQEKLDELREQTKRAQTLLSDIFVEEEDAQTTTTNNSNDDAIRDILSKLLEKDVWQRSEVAEMLGEGVMLGSVLEKINDYAYSVVDDIVVEEDGDTIYVTTEYKEQLI